MILYSMVAPFCSRYSSSNRTLAVDNFLQCWYSISERCPGDRSALTERCSGVKENVNTLNNIFWSSVQYCTKSLESCAGNNSTTCHNCGINCRCYLVLFLPGQAAVVDETVDDDVRYLVQTGGGHVQDHCHTTTNKNIIIYFHNQSTFFLY